MMSKPPSRPSSRPVSASRHGRASESEVPAVVEAAVPASSSSSLPKVCRSSCGFLDGCVLCLSFVVMSFPCFSSGRTAQLPPITKSPAGSQSTTPKGTTPKLGKSDKEDKVAGSTQVTPKGGVKAVPPPAPLSDRSNAAVAASIQSTWALPFPVLWPCVSSLCCVRGELLCLNHHSFD